MSRCSVWWPPPRSPATTWRDEAAFPREYQCPGPRWAIEECLQGPRTRPGSTSTPVRRHDAWYRHITLAAIRAHTCLCVTRRSPRKLWQRLHPGRGALPLPNYFPIRLMRLSRQLIIYTMMMLAHNSKLANIVDRNGYYHLSLVIPKLLPIWDTWHLEFWLNAVAP